MKISEIFHSLEGEGINIGIPEIFIRVQGCSVKCKGCDTPYTLDKKGGKEMNIFDIIKEIDKYNCKRVVLTGGSVEEQKDDALNLIRVLKAEGYYISLEANGVHFTPQLYNEVNFVSCDIKSPSSGMKYNEECINYLINKPNVQFKIVIKNIDDYNFIRDIYNKYFLLYPHKLILTPCWSVGEDLNISFIKKIIDSIKRDGLKVRIILQEHKFIYGHKREV